MMTGERRRRALASRCRRFRAAPSPRHTDTDVSDVPGGAITRRRQLDKRGSDRPAAIAPPPPPPRRLSEFHRPGSADRPRLCMSHCLLRAAPTAPDHGTRRAGLRLAKCMRAAPPRYPNTDVAELSARPGKRRRCIWRTSDALTQPDQRRCKVIQ